MTSSKLQVKNQSILSEPRVNTACDNIVVIDDSDDDNKKDELEESEKKSNKKESGDCRSKSQANALELEAKLKAIVDLVAKNPKNGRSKALDSSDCGSAKRRQVSIAQKTWASKHGYGNEDDDSYDCDYDPLHQYYANSFDEQGSFDDDDNHRTILYSENAFTAFATYRFRDLHLHSTNAYHAETVTPDDCDCGKPHIKVGGKHTCKVGTSERLSAHAGISGRALTAGKERCKLVEVANLKAYLPERIL